MQQQIPELKFRSIWFWIDSNMDDWIKQKTKYNSPFSYCINQEFAGRTADSKHTDAASVSAADLTDFRTQVS